MRMSLGQIFYKTQDLSRAELGTRVEQALQSYNSAEPGSGPWSRRTPCAGNTRSISLPSACSGNPRWRC